MYRGARQDAPRGGEQESRFIYCEIIQRVEALYQRVDFNRYLPEFSLIKRKERKKIETILKIIVCDFTMIENRGRENLGR